MSFLLVVVLFLVLAVVAVVVIVVIVGSRKSTAPQHYPSAGGYPAPYQQQPPPPPGMMPPYPQTQQAPPPPQLAAPPRQAVPPQRAAAPQQAAPPHQAAPPQRAAPPQQAQQPEQAPPAMPPGYGPQPQDQAVTAANGYKLLLPEFGPESKAIISVAVVAQGKVYMRAIRDGSGVFGNGLDLVSGRRRPHEDALTSVRRILAEETGWTGRPLASVGQATFDLGSGEEQDICYAVLLDLPPGSELPSAGITTWAARADLPTLRDLGPRAKVACEFADHALAAAGV